MKKIICAAVFCFLVLAGNCGMAWAAPALEFPDVPAQHWAYPYVSRLTTAGAINGMPDGTFAPGRSITRAEFVTIVVNAVLPPVATSGSGHWASNIMQSATDNQLVIAADEFTLATWDNPIIRQDMAKIVARAMEHVRKEALADNTDAYTNVISDWSTTCEGCKPYIAQAYVKGIITGYPDGSFGGMQNATRAEAATMVVRLIDESYRVQLTADDGRMKIEKAEPYMWLTLESLQFYQEGGKFYVKGNLPELPEGFENWMNIEIQFTGSSNMSGFLGTTHIILAGHELPKAGAFNVHIPDMTSTSQVDFVSIQIAVKALHATNPGYEDYEGHWSIHSKYPDQVSLIDATNHNKVSYRQYDFNQLFTW